MPFVATAQPGAERCVVVIGGANVDVVARSAARLIDGTSNPGSTALTPGGVGRNIAENLARLGIPTEFVGVVGMDAQGAWLLERTAAAGVGVDHVVRSNTATGTYVAVLDGDGELAVAVSAMAATTHLTAEHIHALGDLLAPAALLVLDGNLPGDVVAAALRMATEAGVDVVLDPVSVPKAARLAAELPRRWPLYAVTPNSAELAALTGLRGSANAESVNPEPANVEELRAGAEALHERGVRLVWIRLGAAGSIVSVAGAEPVAIAALPTRVVDVTGAGDAMLAGFVAAALGGADPVVAAHYGHAAAALTVAGPETVRPDLTLELVRRMLPDDVKESSA